MIVLDEDALICDFAQYYHIYNYKDFPPPYVGVLACGLGEESRIKLKLAGSKAPSELILLAHIADSLSTLVWFETEDGQKGRNRPASILNAVIGIEDTEKTVAFDSGDEFERMREKILREINDGN